MSKRAVALAFLTVLLGAATLSADVSAASTSLPTVQWPHIVQPTDGQGDSPLMP